ncbi:restriction endonuclease subunit M [Burkholderia pseudomallei]|uniref:N-6 DNA methylase n=1 Tax=Burkholderia pseudomallei TaxID=28450 RepID=UPI0040629A97
MKKSNVAYDKGVSDLPSTSSSSSTVEEPVGPKEGYIVDFVSGRHVKDSPEEREAVQVFSRMLVEDYGYPLSHIQTRPQFRVKARPSDTKKEYPVDIAVFTGKDKQDDQAYIVVECKKKDRKDGLTQLQDYLRFCNATLGVWFNGAESLYLKKIEKSGKVYFEQIPNIPLFGQRVEDVGLFHRKDLRSATNLKSIFKVIRNYLAANAVGITRDEVFAQQLINLIFCKIYDEKYTKPDQVVSFRAGVGEDPDDVSARIKDLFELVKKRYKDVIEVTDNIQFDPVSLTYIVGALQLYALSQCERDAVGEAFETFIGPSLKGPQGQFFTPRNVVKMVVDMVDPGPDDKIIDPACGSGGFLVEALRHVWLKVEEQGETYGWPEAAIETEKQKVAIDKFRGIDKDAFLSKVAKAYMAILGDGRGGVFCENSLEQPKNWNRKTRDGVQLGAFDVVLTNPPFGKKLAVEAEEILGTYNLGHSWKADDEGAFEKGNVLDKQAPQILFIERCLDLLRDGGKLGIVLLESIFGMPKYRYVVDFITRRANILAIVTLPEDLFQPNTHAKTCVVIVQKTSNPTPHPIFMCDVKWCGHDSRGNPTWTLDNDGQRVLLDEIPQVAELYKKGPKGSKQGAKGSKQGLKESV